MGKIDKEARLKNLDNEIVDLLNSVGEVDIYQSGYKKGIYDTLDIVRIYINKELELIKDTQRNFGVGQTVWVQNIKFNGEDSDGLALLDALECVVVESDDETAKIQRVENSNMEFDVYQKTGYLVNMPGIKVWSDINDFRKFKEYYKEYFKAQKLLKEAKDSIDKLIK